MSILKGPEGGFSSKRSVGIAYAILGIIMVLVGVFTEKETDLDILLVVIGTSLTALDRDWEIRPLGLLKYS